MTARPYADVIGDPIDHSRSPTIHNFWLGALGIEADYHRRRIGRADLPGYLEQRRADPAWRGANVTMPLKLDAITLSDEASDRAVAAGAANLLLPRDGRIFAANTDVSAIMVLLARLHERKLAMESVTLLGNGGAARAALVALKSVGVTNVRIQARDMAQAMKLAVEFGLNVEPAPLTSPIASDGLINATPLGMAGRDCLNCDLSRLPPEGWVFDMVTDPPETPLLAAARQRELAVVTGTEMLVEQAATSFEMFFGMHAPRDRDEQLWQKLGQ
jgi:shikimate dehydrogenase